MLHEGAQITKLYAHETQIRSKHVSQRDKICKEIKSRPTKDL